MIRHACRRGASGFTLVELMVVVLIFSLLALVSYRGLGAVLDTREQVERETAKWRHVDAFLSRFERDIGLAAPRPARGPDGSVPAWHATRTAERLPYLAFSRFSPDGGAPGRVAYMLNGRHEIELLLWPGIDTWPQAQPQRHTLLRGVAGLELRYLGTTQAWTGNWPLPGDSTALPRAVELRLLLDSGERIERIFAMMAAKAGYRGQLGAAIVLAMGIVTLATLAATAIMVTQSAWLRQAELETDHAQARRLVLAGIDWSRAVLRDDALISSVDHLQEPWALRLAPISIDNGEIEGSLDDQQARFNLNNLVANGQRDEAQVAIFRRLLDALDLPPGLAEKLVDWLDADSEALPGGAEDGYYRAMPSPYLAANAPLVEIAELSRVAGFDDTVRARLMPHVSALPRSAPVNVNTAPAEVLAAVVADLGLDRARMMVAQRERGYFRDRADFRSRLPAGARVADSAIAVDSRYFVSRVRVRFGEAEARGSALLERHEGRWPAIAWRQRR